jgi:sulfate transport system permease protein
MNFKEFNMMAQNSIHSKKSSAGVVVDESRFVRIGLIVLMLVLFSLFVFIPLAALFYEALRKGFDAYINAIRDPLSLDAIKLTLMAASVAVPLNLVFGIASAWAITKFDFRGKNFLITLIDVPFSVSPVVSGLVFILLFGRNGWFGAWLETHDLHIIFAIPGIVLASIFVTFPFISRELIPLMQSQGSDEEEAAISLGAGGWVTFFKITLPNIKWGLLYGILLCNARAMGEFGAVSVVSGHIRGLTNTVPLHVEILYNEYNFQAAFAVASLLTFLSLFTLIAKNMVSYIQKKQQGKVVVR